MQTMKVKEAAEKYGVSEMFVREMCRRGVFGTTYGTGKKRQAMMVSPSMIDGWFTERRLLRDEER